MKRTVDHIIVGQGIAGTCVAFELLSRGQSFVMIDDSYNSCSSLVAAGLVNPLVFKRLTKSWNIDKLLPAMYSFFEDVEKQLNKQLIYRKEILKLFTSFQEQNEWAEKEDVIGFEHYIGDVVTKTELESKYNINAPFGGGGVKNSCYIDLPTFLQNSRNHFIEKESLISESFDYNGLQVKSDSCIYQNGDLSIEAKSVIFCEGYKAIDNPFFKDLPFNPAKGEVITFKSDGLHLDHTLNKNGFVMPRANGTFKLGATYEWKDLTNNVTEKGKQELLDKLTILKDRNVEVVDHKAGVRPTVKDRRPLIGKNEDQPLYIFNGLGTKGALIAPYYTLNFIDFLLDQSDLDEEVDIKRFQKNK